jgi:hypothetical protein
VLQEENRLKRQEIERFEKLKNSFDRTEAEIMIVKEQNTEFQVLLLLLSPKRVLPPILLHCSS